MATATSVWAKPGAWALESEEHAALEKDNVSAAFPSLTADVAAAEVSGDYPSLAAAAASKPSKKKKPQTLSLAEFSGGKPVNHGAGARSALSSKGLTHDELLLLPTGPRERTAEELERSTRGFGYSSYGSGGPRRATGERSLDRGSGDESRRSSINWAFEPSRSDEVEDWGATKKPAAFPERRDRGSGFFDSQSRADEVDSWVSKKSAAPLSDAGRRVNGGGVDGLGDKRGSFEMFGKERSSMGGPDSDTWGKRSEEFSRVDSDLWGRKKEEVNSDTWGRKTEEVNASVGGRPRLVLQARSLPLANGNGNTNAELNQEEKQTLVVKNKGFNPFGEARPREEVLAEKGKDWKKLDEKLESLRIREDRSEGLPSKKKGAGSVMDNRSERSWRKENSSDVSASLEEEKAENFPDN
ncbi:hypothetical protein AXF42_Ash016910 [Apostasia shenzhenica]|uniref:Eukaryotic translation initiation factor 4B3 n=1 Tax=Apostasia shenzhenica TaxID=1088818 RepID=A0A2H9ZRG1_9ASPA|nr:hypothetical protein AXF42_Ash016910 [Apostasia shenzhenica]